MEDRQEVWNRLHTAKDKDALSGQDPAEMLRHHGLDDPRPGIFVLDIGVGLGLAARFFSERGCTVDCLDVADAARRAVGAWARRFYLAKDIEMLPTSEYDLAISHLTAQHMTDADLREQVREVARSLKRGGIFSLHLAGSRIPGEDNLKGPIPEGYDGRMCRTPEYALEMVLEEVPAKGRKYQFHILDNIMEWPEFKSYWFFLQVRREW